MWNSVGLALALSLAAVAFARSRSRGGHYDSGVYGMVPGTHRRYAAIGLAFATFFAFALLFRWETAGPIALAGLVLSALFYATSFLRGYADEDERF